MLETEKKLAHSINKPKDRVYEDEKVQFEGYTPSNAKDLEVPFIYFFHDAIKAGLISNLGEIEKLKEQNNLYAKYLDRWMFKAIEDKLIEIGSDGSFKYNKDNKNVFWGHNNDTLTKILEPIAKTVTDVAIKDLKKTAKAGLSSVNVLSVYSTPDSDKEFKSIVNECFVKINNLKKKTKKIENNDKVHYISLSTCSLDKEVLSEI